MRADRKRPCWLRLPFKNEKKELAPVHKNTRLKAHAFSHTKRGYPEGYSLFYFTGNCHTFVLEGDDHDTGDKRKQEPVFSGIVAFFFAGEILLPRAYAGALLMLAGLFFMEFDVKGLLKKQQNRKSV